MARWKTIIYEIQVIGWRTLESGQMAKKQRQECDSELQRVLQIDSLTLSQIKRENKRLNIEILESKKV